MNIVLDNCVEFDDAGDRIQLGMSMVRGNSIAALEVIPDSA